MIDGPYQPNSLPSDWDKGDWIISDEDYQKCQKALEQLAILEDYVKELESRLEETECRLDLLVATINRE